MNEARFSRPVRLHHAETGERLVASAWEAIECLRGQWPADAPRCRYRAAYRICRDALDGWRRPEEARQAFVKAAESAGLLAASRSRGRNVAPLGLAARTQRPVSAAGTAGR